MARLTLVYSGDFQGYPMGGVLEYVKNFARYAPVELRIVGLTLNPATPLGEWTTVRLKDVERPFLPILYVDEARQQRSRIPLNYRFVRALKAYRARYWEPDTVFYIQRAEHGLAFLRLPNPLYFNTHGQSAFFEKWTTHPLFRWRWFRAWFYRTEARVIRRAQGVFVISPADYEYYANRFPEQREKIHFIPLGIETEEYLPPGERAGEPPTILFVGRLDASKGLDLLIAGFAELRKRMPTARLILVGGSQDYNPMEAQVKAWIEQYGVHEGVEMTGLIPREAIIAYYHKAHVFTLTSHWEGLPTALLEAMACGLPAVVTAVGGMPSVVKDDQNGYVLLERDPAQLAQLLERAYHERERLGTEARRTAERYSIRQHAYQVCQQMGLVEDAPTAKVREQAC
ncbi:Glycosyltransferase involved in cell wall bisynthesis [Armatimonadetes bacterium DC]|nr:Glycosyltransferase involved in cell wall bisynthesis [Armatimonadetes bacterium DC]